MRMQNSNDFAKAGKRAKSVRVESYPPVWLSRLPTGGAAIVCLTSNLHAMLLER
jgi:hypothetical protein